MNYDQYTTPELVAMIANISEEISKRLTLPEINERIALAKAIRQLGVTIQKRLTCKNKEFGSSEGSGIYTSGYMCFVRCVGFDLSASKRAALFEIIRSEFKKAPKEVQDMFEVADMSLSSLETEFKVPFRKGMTNKFFSKGIHKHVFGEFTNAELCKSSEEW